MINGVNYAHLGPIWYHSEPLDIPFSLNQLHGWDFFTVSYSKTALELPFTHLRIHSEAKVKNNKKSYPVKKLGAKLPQWPKKTNKLVLIL